MNLLIVSGLSGSGKTIALQAIEDMGVYCIDNLPAALLPHFVQQLVDAAADRKIKAAVGIDARTRSFLAALPEALKKLDAMGIENRIIFLEADETILVKRYKETRRKHPMIDEGTSLLEGIRLERELLEPLSFNAAIRIDTTHKTPNELRQQIRDFVGVPDSGGITILFESFGFKHGTPMDADYVFDIRCLPNPYWQPELRRFSGLDEPVRQFMQQHKQVEEMTREIAAFLERWLPSFVREQRTYMTVAIGCTGGQHRSVYLVEKLGEYFKKQGTRTQIRHRELQ